MTFYLKIRGPKKWIYDAVTSAIHRGADLVIVTNEALVDHYARRFPDTRYWVLPDMIPPLAIDPEHGRTRDGICLLLICTYAEDEPYQEVFKAMKDLAPCASLRYGEKRKSRPRSLGPQNRPNVILTGFIPDRAFFDLLHKVDIVIDLTDTDHCMVCGAYEAVAAEKPMVLSAKQVLMQYFYKGAVFTENRSESVVVAIRRAIANIDTLKIDVRELKAEKQTQWRSQWAGLLTTIGLERRRGMGGAKAKESRDD